MRTLQLERAFDRIEDGTAAGVDGPDIDRIHRSASEHARRAFAQRAGDGGGNPARQHHVKPGIADIPGDLVGRFLYEFRMETVECDAIRRCTDQCSRTSVAKQQKS